MWIVKTEYCHTVKQPSFFCWINHNEVQSRFNTSAHPVNIKHSKINPERPFMTHCTMQKLSERIKHVLRFSIFTHWLIIQSTAHVHNLHLFIFSQHMTTRLYTQKSNLFGVDWMKALIIFLKPKTPFIANRDVRKG